LEARRAPVAHPGEWQHVAPLTPAATGAAAPIVSASASFLASLAGARPIVDPGSLRDVSAGAPRGVVKGLAQTTHHPSRSTPPAEDDEPPAPPELPDVAPPHRPTVGASRRSDVDLTSYAGPLEYVEYDEAPEPEVPDEAARGDSDVPEELPPPIFTSLLAERTGRDLTELRPDLAEGYAAGTEADDAALREGAEGVHEPRRKRSLAESRRLGLGAPLPSAAVPVERREADDEIAAVESIEVIEPPEPVVPIEIEPPSPPPSLPPILRRASVRYRAAEPAPESVRAEVRRVLGRDPGPTHVRRDPEASRVSARIGARAYTRAGEVFVPHEAGPLDGPETRALLAHELTHVVQQRVYGAALPAPTTAGGRRLEAEARAVERVVRGEDTEPRVAPVRTLRPSADGPRMDSGGFLREVTRQLKPRGSDESGSASGLTSDIWRAPGDAAEDPDFQRAVAEDRQAYERWRVDHNTSSDPAARDQMDRQELERHARFMEQYGSRLYGGGAGAGGGGTDFGADYSNAPSVAAHEAFAGAFTEGWRGLDLGVGGFLGQFGRRDTHEQEAIRGRIAEYGHDYGRRRAGESDADYQARVQRLQGTLHAAGVLPAQTATGPSVPSARAAAPAQPTGTTPLTGSSATASTPSTTAASPAAPTHPATGQDTAFTPGPVAAHEAFAGVFTEGWRGLDLGIGDFLGQFGRRDTHEQEAIAGRIAEYGHDYGPRREGESDAEYEARTRRLQATVQGAGVVPPATTPPTGAAAAPAAGAATPAQDGAAPSPAPGTAVVGAAAVGAAAGAGAATAASAMHGERGSRGREREVPGADPTDVLAHLDDHDVEALASMLYGRIVTRFRRQLLIDRERSGFLTDFR
jgi:hypothetical protein